MSSTRPLLSVLVPVYNVAPYLEQCLDSILSQPYSDLEVLVIDDGSTDGSGALCDRYAERDQRIRVVHQVNAGLSAARNAAMDLMQGEFFTCVDSDDWLTEDAFSAPMSYLEANPLVDALELGYIEVNCRTGEERTVLAQGAEFTSEEALRHLADLFGVTGMAWGKIYRTETMGRLRFPVGRPYEDTPFVFEVLARAHRYRYLSWLGYHYRIARSGSITESYDGRIVYLFENLLDLRPTIEALQADYLPLLHETLYRRLLIFSLWAMRHAQTAPGLLSHLLPYTKRLRSLSYPKGSQADRLRRRLFLSFPRLFLSIKRCTGHRH